MTNKKPKLPSDLVELSKEEGKKMLEKFRKERYGSKKTEIKHRKKMKELYERDIAEFKNLNFQTEIFVLAIEAGVIANIFAAYVFYVMNWLRGYNPKYGILMFVSFFLVMGVILILIVNELHKKIKKRKSALPLLTYLANMNEQRLMELENPELLKYYRKEAKKQKVLDEILKDVPKETEKSK